MIKAEMKIDNELLKKDGKGCSLFVEGEEIISDADIMDVLNVMAVMTKLSNSVSCVYAKEDGYVGELNLSTRAEKMKWEVER